MNEEKEKVEEMSAEVKEEAEAAETAASGTAEELPQPLRRQLPQGGSQGRETKGDACVHEKIEALKEEIRRDIDSLVTQKREILQMIGQLSKPEYQTVLELRYLRGWTWNRIAMNMHFCEAGIYKLHNAALKEFCSF